MCMEHPNWSRDVTWKRRENQKGRAHGAYGPIPSPPPHLPRFLKKVRVGVGWGAEQDGATGSGIRSSAAAAPHLSDRRVAHRLHQTDPLPPNPHPPHPLPAKMLTLRITLVASCLCVAHVALVSAGLFARRDAQTPRSSLPGGRAGIPQSAGERTHFPHFTAIRGRSAHP